MTGGILHTTIKNCPPGLGEPAFDKLKADLAKAVLSIGGATAFVLDMQKNFAGIEGGMSSGADISFFTHFKAPSTHGETAKEGRHDPSIIFRALPVVEAMAKLVIVDHHLRQEAYHQYGRN